MTKTRVAIYTRVSSEEQIEGYSLAAQQEIATKFAESKDWQIVKVYEERGRSGKTTIRPEFQAMMQDAKLKRFDVILVHKLDRFSRSLLDVLLSIKALHEQQVVLVSASEPMLDFSTSQGKLMAIMMAAFAEWYLDNLRDEIKKGKQERARQGDWNGTLSHGYTTPKQLSAELEQLGQLYKAGRVTQEDYEEQSKLLENALEAAATKHDTAAIPHPIHRHAIVLAFSTYAQGGASFMDVADLLNMRGYRIRERGTEGMHPFHRDTIEGFLKNRFYTGVVQYKGEWSKGAHEPLITQELFEECQRARKRRAQKHHISPPNSKRIYPLGGLLVCLECGNQWYGNVLRGRPVYRDTPRQRMHQCSAPIKSVDAEVLENVIGDWLCSIEFNDDIQARLRAASNKQSESDATERQRAKVQRQLDNLTILFKLDDISQEDYLKQRAVLRAQLASMSRIEDVTIAEIQQVAELITSLRPVWKKATLQEKKLILQRLVKTVYIRHGEIVAIEPLPVLWHLIRSAGKTGFEPAIGRYHPITA
jgi:DNA invertase Pin-like site-specific DNA recombinase